MYFVACSLTASEGSVVENNIEIAAVEFLDQLERGNCLFRYRLMVVVLVLMVVDGESSLEPLNFLTSSPVLARTLLEAGYSVPGFPVAHLYSEKHANAYCSVRMRTEGVVVRSALGYSRTFYPDASWLFHPTNRGEI